LVKQARKVKGAILRALLSGRQSLFLDSAGTVPRSMTLILLFLVCRFSGFFSSLIFIENKEELSHSAHEAISGHAIGWNEFLCGRGRVLADGLHEAEGGEPAVPLLSDVHSGPRFIGTYCCSAQGISLAIASCQNLKNIASIKGT
jgi:hypothetical protein